MPFWTRRALTFTRCAGVGGVLNDGFVFDLGGMRSAHFAPAWWDRGQFLAALFRGLAPGDLRARVWRGSSWQRLLVVFHQWVYWLWHWRCRAVPGAAADRFASFSADCVVLVGAAGGGD